MGFYDRHILPHCIDLAMRSSIARAEREVLIPRARGQVLEIGAGSGLNLPHYTSAVDGLIALEPSDGLNKKAAKRARKAAFPVSFLAADAETIPLADESLDTVVTTWTLCTIAEPARALTEMRRVLKADGRLLFVEHGRAPDPWVARLQDGLNRPWGCFAGGCNLNRRPDTLIEDAGFRFDDFHAAYGEGPKLLTYLYKGSAKKA